jgi:2-hydroxy-3-oxopropionate reductase
MMGGVASSRVLELFGKRMVERSFENGIDARLYYKDLDIALNLVHELGLAVPAAALTMQSVNALIGRGEGRNDLSALINVVEAMNARRPS